MLPRSLAEGARGVLEFIVPQEADAFRGDSDADLLAYMALRVEDPDSATAAYAEFYTRHVRWLYGTLMHHECQHLLGGPEAVAEFVQDTFQRAFEAAGTFDPGEVTDPTIVRRLARAWLGRIGTHLMVDAMRRGAPGAFEEVGELNSYTAPSDEDVPSEEVAVLRSLLEELPDREKDIVLESMLHYKPGATHQRLPNEASAALAQRWGTTTANIRVIRKRTFDRLREDAAKRLAERSGERR